MKQWCIKNDVFIWCEISNVLQKWPNCPHICFCSHISECRCANLIGNCKLQEIAKIYSSSLILICDDDDIWIYAWFYVMPAMTIEDINTSTNIFFFTFQKLLSQNSTCLQASKLLPLVSWIFTVFSSHFISIYSVYF